MLGGLKRKEAPAGEPLSWWIPARAAAAAAPRHFLSRACAARRPQDFRLSELIAREGRAAVIVLNKWDKVDTDKTTQVLGRRAVRLRAPARS